MILLLGFLLVSAGMGVITLIFERQRKRQQHWDDVRNGLDRLERGELEFSRHQRPKVLSRKSDPAASSTSRCPSKGDKDDATLMTAEASTKSHGHRTMQERALPDPPKATSPTNDEFFYEVQSSSADSPRLSPTDDDI